jgi:SAM-dependent methyltransferase
VSTRDKYAALAEGFAEHEYANPELYSSRRADVIAGLGPPIQPGDTVLDLCCADGIMAAPLTRLGLSYSGVDATEAMVAAAGRRNPGLEFVTGRMEDFEPAQPVDITICLRSFYLAEDRVAFFRRVRGYTRKKLVFDFRPMVFPIDGVLAQLREAGFSEIELRPFFLPQRKSLPGVALPLLSVLEHTGPVGLALTNRVGCVFCSASA